MLWWRGYFILYPPLKARNRMQLNLIDATVRKQRLQRLHCISKDAKRNFTSDKVYAICSTHSSGDHSYNVDLEFLCDVSIKMQ